MPHIHISHFVLTSFSDALVTFICDQVTQRPLQPMLSTGSEQQGQNIRVRTVFLTLTKILDLLIFFHQVCKKLNTFINVHVYSPRAGVEHPSGTKFSSQKKFFVTLPNNCRF